MKKFLFVLCLALLLTLVCASALAVDYKTPNGTLLSAVTVINEKTVDTTKPFVVVVTPTCYQQGIASFTMTDGSTESVTIDYAHDLEKRTLDGKKPTCEENGQGKYFCKICGKEDPYGQGIINIEATGHKMDKVVIDDPGTCYKAGSKHTECSVCGEPERNGDGSIKYEAIKKKDHQWADGNWVIVKAQTCKEGGIRYMTCANCGEPRRKDYASHDGTKDIDYDYGPGQAEYKLPAPHTFGEWVTKSEASCKDGLRARYCSVCNLEEQQVIAGDPAKHIWETKYNFTANCKAVGGVAQAAVPGTELTGTKTCKVCNKTEDIPVGDLPANYMKHHHFVADPNGNNVPAGCVGGADGKKALVCTSCGGKYEEPIPAATSHNFGEWVMTVKPGTDGTKNGVWERYCKNYNCVGKEVYVGKTAPNGAPTTAPTTAPTGAPTTAPSGSEKYQVTSWGFSGTSVSGQVKGNVTYRTPGLSVNVIIYTPQGTFLATSADVDENGAFKVSAGGAVYAVSIQLKDNNKTYQTDGKYV